MAPQQLFSSQLRVTLLPLVQGSQTCPVSCSPKGQVTKCQVKQKLAKDVTIYKFPTLSRKDDNSLPLTGVLKQLGCYFKASIELGLLEFQPSVQRSRAKALAAGACGICCLLVGGLEASGHFGAFLLLEMFILP